MSDINLRDYLAKLHEWLQEGAADQVIWHARHILQYYPRNVEAYRCIGQALLTVGRIDEAYAVLRRVLSVIPDDAAAHRLLSEIQERRSEPARAIWHMERAFEQDTSNRAIIEQLQRLYREHRKIANPRLQLTTAAAVRQNMRSGALERAIDTLRSTLNRNPQRNDLRLLLSQALWQRGDKIDAAEVAVDVLQSLPDCLPANHMIAELWLSEGRPSDAQRFLNKVESVDPYRALALVQRRPADPDAFRLPELDSQRQAQMEINSTHLDWLEGIETQAQEDKLPIGESSDTGSIVDRMIGAAQATSAESAGEDEWIQELDAIEVNYSLNTGALQAVTSPLAPEDVSPVSGSSDQTPEELPATDSLSFDWAEANLTDTEYPTSRQDDPFAWLRATEPEPTETIAATDENTYLEDPLAWVNRSGIELHDTAPLSEPYEQSELRADAEADPMAWMRGYGVEADDEPDTRSANEEDVSLSLGSSSDSIGVLEDELLRGDLPFPEHDDNDLDVVQETRIPFERGIVPTLPLEPRLDATPDLPDTALDDWELTHSLLDESLGLEALSDTPRVSPDDFLDTLDRFAEPASAFENAMQPTETPLFPESSAPEWASGSTEQGTDMPDQPTPDFDWLDEQPEDEGKTPSSSSSGATGMLNWLAQEERGEIPSEPAPDETQKTPDVKSSGVTDALDWLSQAETPEEPPQTPDTVSSSDDGSTGSTGMLNWLSENRPLPPTLPLDPQASGGTSEDLDADWISSLGDTDESAPETETTGSTGMLDWLNSTGSLGQPSEQAEGAEESAPEPIDEWLSSMFTEEAQASDLPAAQAQTWDEQLQAEAEAVAPEPVAPANLAGEDWLTDIFDEQPEPSPEPDDDWSKVLEAPEMGDAAPTEEPWVETEPTALEPESPVMAGWENQPAELEQQAVESDLPQATYGALQEQAPSYGVDSDSGEEASASPAYQEQNPDWLTEISEVTPQASQESKDWEVEAGGQPHTAPHEADWLMADANEEPLVEDESPIEGSAAASLPVTESISQGAESASAIDEQFNEATPEEAVEASLLDAGQEQGVPEWMSEQPAAAIEEAVQAEAEWVSDVSAEPEYRESGLDWLTAGAAALTGTAAANILSEEDEQSAPSGESSEWDFEQAAPEAAEDVQVHSAGFEADDAFASAAAEEALVTPAENAPDWLNAMVPGLDIDPAAEADAPIETDFAVAAEAGAPTMPENFAWLTDIVDEETRPQPAAADGVRVPRFVFSRPPVWLRRLLSRASDPIASDEDLPAWLR